MTPSSVQSDPVREDSSEPRRIPALDGLRAFAVAGVLIAHYLPEDWWINRLHLGQAGVTLFFVLSGFLITGILLRARADRKAGGLRSIVKAFYARRFLRLMPPYYALLLVYLVAGIDLKNGVGISCVLYVFNFLSGFVRAPYLYLGHLWTLCIEEQFYLVWPFLVLFLSRTRLPRVSLCLCLGAPLFRLALAAGDVDAILIRNLPFSQLDALTMGGLLALARAGILPAHWCAGWTKWRNLAALLGLGSFFWLVDAPPVACLSVLGGFGSAVLMLRLVEGAVDLKAGWAQRALCFGPIQYLGKISYGIYLYQFVSLFVVYKLIGLLHHPGWSASPLGFAALWVCITILLAVVSWHAYERPLLRLKARFSYSSGKSAAARQPELV